MTVLQLRTTDLARQGKLGEWGSRHGCKLTLHGSPPGQFPLDSGVVLGPFFEQTLPTLDLSLPRSR